MFMKIDLASHFSNLLLFIVFAICTFSADAKTQSEKENPFVIGVDADLSLAAKASGEAILAGVKIAVDELNERGGLLGRKFRIEAKDHAGVSARGIANIKEFSKISELIGVVGGIHSNVILSELDSIHENKIPYLIPWAAAVEIVDNGRIPNFVFRLGACDAHVGEFLVSKAMQRGKRIALLLENTVWGRSNRQAMMSAMKRRGKRPVVVQWVDRDVSDLSPQIVSLLAAKTDVVLMVLNGPESALAVRQMAERKVPFVILSHWGLTSGGFFEKAADALKKIPVYFFQPFSFLNNQNSIAKSLLRRYQNIYGKADPRAIPAAAGIAHAYDLTRILAQAAEKAGELDRSKIRDALERLPNYSGVSHVIQPPFTQERHEALNYESYFLAKFNLDGGIEPL